MCSVQYVVARYSNTGHHVMNSKFCILMIYPTEKWQMCMLYKFAFVLCHGKPLVKNFLFRVVKNLQLKNECVENWLSLHSFILNHGDHAETSVTSPGMSTMSLCAAGTQCVRWSLSTRITCSHCKGSADRTWLYQLMCEVWHAQHLRWMPFCGNYANHAKCCVAKWHFSVFGKTKDRLKQRLRWGF